jgi:hypothetical protein
MELAQDHVQWRDFVLAVLNPGALLLENYLTNFISRLYTM